MSHYCFIKKLFIFFKILNERLLSTQSGRSLNFILHILKRWFLRTCIPFFYYNVKMNNNF